MPAPVKPAPALAAAPIQALPMEAAKPVKPALVPVAAASQAPLVETARVVKPDPAPPVEVGRPARRTAAGSTSLVRALGLKLQRVVIDPGHGGHDEGTQGPKGLLEKDLVLDVAMRLGKLIEDRMGAR